MTVDISVLIPAYNAEATIFDCLSSVVENSDVSYEVIVINDGSTDQTQYIAEKYTLTRPNYFVLNKVNGGISSALNAGLALSRGTYIARLDADDLNFPHRLGKQLTFMKDSGLDLCGTDIMLRYKDRSKECSASKNIVKANPRDHFSLLLQMAITVPIFHPTAMFKKSLIDGCNNFYSREKNIKAEDYELWTKVFDDKVRIGNLSEPLVQYSVSSSSLSSKNNRQIKKQSVEIGYQFVRSLSYFELHAAITNAKNLLIPDFCLLDRSLIRIFILRPDLRSVLWRFFILKRRLPLKAIAKECWILSHRNLLYLKSLFQLCRHNSN